MDRRRFEAAHLKYASLQMATWYPEATSYNQITFEGDVKDTLNEIMPALCSFEARYAGLYNTVDGTVRPQLSQPLSYK